MTDISSITSILGSIKTATDIARFFKETTTSLEKAETKLKLADLISALADAKIEAADIQSLIVEKDEEIKRLKETLEIKQQVKYEKPYYWLGEGDNKDGPYCQHCYDQNGKLIRLQSYDNGRWDCKACQNKYTDSSYVPPKPMKSVVRSSWMSL
jgi:ribosomal protein L37AE/L43A